MTDLYLSEGKAAFRELLLGLARREGVRSVGTFYGTGIDSRLFAAAGFDVLAAEVNRALHPVMDADAAVNGFRAWHGDAARITERLDMFHADFIGNASGHAFRVLGRIAANTDRWLAVTLATDHQINPWMQGESALYTVPAWLTGASGFTLDYFGRYVRNRGGQTMFVALLRRDGGRGVAHYVQPIQVARSVTERGYWASKPMYARRLLAHMQEPRTIRVRAGDAARYQLLKQNRPKRSSNCRVCGSPFVLPMRQGRPPTTCSSRCKMTATYQYHRRWYLKRLAAVSGTATEAISVGVAA